MLFNSDVFLKFFAAFLLLFWLARNRLSARNLLIVIASYLFYGWWVVAAGLFFGDWYDWRFLALLVFTSLLDFAVGLGLDRLKQPRQRKFLLSASVVANLGILGLFKYYGFFVRSLTDVLTRLGVSFQPHVLDIILPVGISFYTFQSMSYTIDVYRRELPATRNVINFLAYVSFFPQLVAGPIERAKHLLPQFERPVSITYPMLEEGIWLVLWGLFKKVVLADNLAPLVDLVYQGDAFTGPAVVLGTLAFAVQIYCDFSGYSDIARGTARVLGFDIMWNFNLPYAATSVREFWQRWHISLSTWLRDYLYIPLGGNRRGSSHTYLNLLITMLLGGLWHGAAWSFVLWGAWHGAGLAVHRFMDAHRANSATRPAWNQPVCWLGTLLFVLYGWLLFRARSLDQIIAMTRALGNWTSPSWLGAFAINLATFSLPLIIMETWQARRQDKLAALSLPRWGKALLQGALLLAIVLFWERNGVQFIYFQF